MLSGKQRLRHPRQARRGLRGKRRRKQGQKRGHGKEQEALPPAHVAAAKAADQLGGEQGDERGQHRLAEAVRGPRGQGLATDVLTDGVNGGREQQIDEDKVHARRSQRSPGCLAR